MTPSPGPRSFPAHFPDCCPPARAGDASGVVYRITEHNPPEASDFLTYHEEGKDLRDPNPTAVCRSHGISVYRNVEDARHRKSLLPGVTLYIAAGTLTAEHGRMMPTGKPTHMTWWCYDGVCRHCGFVVLPESGHVVS